MQIYTHNVIRSAFLETGPLTELCHILLHTHKLNLASFYLYSVYLKNKLETNPPFKWYVKSKSLEIFP